MNTLIALGATDTQVCRGVADGGFRFDVAVRRRRTFDTTSVETRRRRTALARLVVQAFDTFVLEVEILIGGRPGVGCGGGEARYAAIRLWNQRRAVWKRRRAVQVSTELTHCAFLVDAQAVYLCFTCEHAGAVVGVPAPNTSRYWFIRGTKWRFGRAVCRVFVGTQGACIVGANRRVRATVFVRCARHTRRHFIELDTLGQRISAAVIGFGVARPARVVDTHAVGAVRVGEALNTLVVLLVTRTNFAKASVGEGAAMKLFGALCTHVFGFVADEFECLAVFEERAVDGCRDNTGVFIGS